MTVYFAKLWKLLLDFPTDPAARRFVFAVGLAFLPAAIVGSLSHGFIKSVLFESPSLICVTLIVGGIALFLVDRLTLDIKYDDAMVYPPLLAFKIGIFQCLALIPGVSRSGATIAGALLMGCDKRSAAEFSFFLAMPTMAGAFAFDLYKNRNLITADEAMLIGAGFVASFLAGVVVVRTLLDFVSRHGFAAFAVWRIVVGIGGLIGLWLVG